MSDTSFVDGVTLTAADWFNDVNRLHYTILSDPADAAAVRAALSLTVGTNILAFSAAASQAEAEAGTEVALRTWSPLRVAQAIAALAGTTGTITAGTPLVLNPYSASATTTQAHGLSAAPSFYKIVLECLSTEGNWGVGEIALTGPATSSDGSATPNWTISPDTTNVVLITSSVGLYLLDKTSRAAFLATPAKWKMTITPFKLN